MAETTSANYPAALADNTSLLGDHSNQLSLTLGAICLIDAAVITTTGAIATGAGGVNAPGYCLIDSEIIHFTGVSGATLTGCTRPSNAAGGGAAAEHASGTTVYFVPVANWANQVKDEIIATQTELGTDPAGAFTDVDTSLNTWLLGVTNGITAGTTQTIAGATALTKGINRVSTVANTGDAVALPTAVAGLEILIINDGANTMKVFPCNGASDRIDGGSVDAVDTNQIAAASSRRYIAVDATYWYTASPAAGSVPSDVVAYRASSAATPSGWSEYTTVRGRVVVGLVSGGTDGGTVGTALTDAQDKTHSHTGPSHTHILALSGAHPSESVRVDDVYGTSGTAAAWVQGGAATSGDTKSRNLTDTGGTGATGTAATSDVLAYIQLMAIKSD